ncbi:uncharacterized protein EDB91DRAFT_1082481 [Suillus paluster]|uniref:uncharacterized protein n=1 Tax=Suillus paluster TaxID=48578 RepID=UPI001B883562|nr:uncharacterized protein EDB91DRAFT_1082481 [Suillus paluster]KAG1739149.1 hypothetical protein EDB91DRAFT_1082481 [Suillus paluster]
MAISSTSPAPDTGSDAFLAASRDAELPVTPGHVTIASSAPDAGSGALSRDTPVMLGHVTSNVISQPVNMLAPPPTSTTPSVPPPSELSAPAVTDWSAELCRRWSESHITRLERRRLNNPYAKVTTWQENCNAMDQTIHDLRRYNVKLAKNIMWWEEQHEQDLKNDDRDVDTFCSQLEEARKHRKHRRVVDAWRKHLFEQKKGKSREERRHLDELRREGPPPGWEPSEYGGRMGGWEMRDGRWETGDGRWEMGHGRQETGDGTREMGHGTRDTGHGTRDMGHGTRDTGHGTRDTGHGTRDMGHRTWDTGQDNWEEVTWDTGLRSRGLVPRPAGCKPVSQAPLVPPAECKALCLLPVLKAQRAWTHHNIMGDRFCGYRKNGQWVNMGMGRWRMEKWEEEDRRMGEWENRRTGEREIGKQKIGQRHGRIFWEGQD